MALKQDLPNSSSTNSNYTAEANYYKTLFDTKPRTSTSDLSYTSTTSSIVYATAGSAYAGQGQEGLMHVLSDALSLYSPSASDFNIKQDNNYAVDSGTTANTYIVTLSSAPTSYTDGLPVSVKIANSSTGASTLNVNSLGAKTIVDALGNAIASNTLQAGIIYTLRYNSTSGNFILQGGGGSSSVNLLTNTQYRLNL